MTAFDPRFPPVFAATPQTPEQAEHLQSLLRGALDEHAASPAPRKKRLPPEPQSNAKIEARKKADTARLLNCLTSEPKPVKVLMDMTGMTKNRTTGILRELMDKGQVHSVRIQYATHYFREERAE